MPAGNPIDSMITALDAQIEKEKAEHSVKLIALNEKKQQLLAISHQQ